MANIIRIKRSATAATPTSLARGEMAYSELSKTLFIGITGGVMEAIAGNGVYAKLASPAFTGTPTAPSPSASEDSTRIATTEYVKDQSVTLTGDVTGTATLGVNLATTLANSGVTAGTYPKVSVNAKGIVTSGSSLTTSDIPTLTASKISDFDTQVRTSRLDQMAAPTASVGFNSQQITNVASPTQAHHAANKAYVDAIKEGLDWKDSVKAATTANITLSALQDIDGVTILEGDRVLVKNQTTASQNGIYVASASAWTRAADADSSADITTGMYCYVEQGSTNSGSGFVMSTLGTVAIGTTAINFIQYSGAGQIVAGDGLSKTGNQIDVNVAISGGLQISSDALQLKLNGSSLTVDNSGLKVTDGTYQPLDADLTAIAALSSTGMISRTAANTWVSRTMTGTANRIVVTNGDGISGAPSFDIGSDVLVNSSDIDGGDF